LIVLETGLGGKIGCDQRRDAGRFCESRRLVTNIRRALGRNARSDRGVKRPDHQGTVPVVTSAQNARPKKVIRARATRMRRAHSDLYRAVLRRSAERSAGTQPKHNAARWPSPLCVRARIDVDNEAIVRGLNECPLARALFQVWDERTGCQTGAHNPSGAAGSG